VTDKGSTPSLAEVLQAALDNIKAQLHVAMPGTVVSYDEASQKANVQPQIKSLIIDQEGNEELLSLPELPSVPVVFPRGGGFFVSFPLQPGDQVLLVICDRELNVWKSKGGDVSPQDPRTHHLADAVAIPGCYPFTDVLADAHASNMVLGKDGGAQVHIKTNGQVHIGSENADAWAAREGDDVQVTIPAGTFLVSASGGVLNPSPVVVDGSITSGSSTVKVDD
jgi:hypothetical protein